MWYGTPKFSTPLQEKSHGVSLCGWYSGVIIYPSWNLLRQLRLHLASLYLLALLVDSEAFSFPSSLQLSRICREICALLPMTIQPHTFPHIPYPLSTQLLHHSSQGEAWDGGLRRSSQKWDPRIHSQGHTPKSISIFASPDPPLLYTSLWEPN